MLARMWKPAAALLSSAVALALSGCCKSEKCESVRTVRATPCARPCTTVSDNCLTPCTADMPPNAKAGECYAKVFIPPKTRTVTERICIREASERLEVVPAEYEWVEERICVKEGCSQLECSPAEYVTREKVIEVEPCHTDWKMRQGAKCVAANNEPVSDVFCLVKTPPVFKTVSTVVMCKPPCSRQIALPAEYTTVRRQKLKNPAHTQKICIPAEYTTVDKTIVTECGRMEWQRVVCEERAGADTINAIKNALATAGYKPGPSNGQLDAHDWAALKDFQGKNGLAVGGLTYATVRRLGVHMN